MLPLPVLLHCMKPPFTTPSAFLCLLDVLLTNLCDPCHMSLYWLYTLC